MIEQVESISLKRSGMSLGHTLPLIIYSVQLSFSAAFVSIDFNYLYLVVKLLKEVLYAFFFGYTRANVVESLLFMLMCWAIEENGEGHTLIQLLLWTRLRDRTVGFLDLTRQWRGQILNSNNNLLIFNSF